MNNTNWRPVLSDPNVQKQLPQREAAYFNLLSYCRHIGLRKINPENATWIARVRKKDGGYKQHCLGSAWLDGEQQMCYEEAVEKAGAWFKSPTVRSVAAEPYQVGSKRTLSICPVGQEYSVGHALSDYLDWKRMAATKSHFETLVSLINYHLVPRVSHIPIEEFDGKDFHDLAMDVIETPPKTGRRAPRTKISIRDLSEDELRRRKKTLNALVSILRGAFEIAWEYDKLHSERPKKCLRRVPNVDRPRVVFLDRTECRHLLDACTPDLQTLVKAALYTGCRANELIQMRVGDVSSRMDAVYVASPKGRRSRHVFLPSEGVRFFRDLAKGRTSSDRLFRKANGRVWGGEYKTYFQAARTKAGLPPKLTFHGLRHTYASQLVEAGASLMVVAEQLGHANTQTVSATYGHLAAGHRAEEIQRCFSPLIIETALVSPQSDLCEKQGTFIPSGHSPKFLETEDSAWPRSNFSRLSGPLLREIRDRGGPEDWK